MIFQVADHLVYLIIGTLLQAVALQFAYKNVKFVSRVCFFPQLFKNYLFIQEKIATLRSEAIAAEVSNQVGKQINRQELDDRILHRKVRVAHKVK